MIWHTIRITVEPVAAIPELAALALAALLLAFLAGCWTSHKPVRRRSRA